MEPLNFFRFRSPLSLDPPRVLRLLAATAIRFQQFTPDGEWPWTLKTR